MCVGDKIWKISYTAFKIIFVEFQYISDCVSGYCVCFFRYDCHLMIIYPYGHILDFSEFDTRYNA